MKFFLSRELSKEDAEKVDVRRESESIHMIIHSWDRSLGHSTIVA